MQQDELDRELLTNLSERESRIADAATRLAYNRVGDWLSMRQAKSAQCRFGEDPDRAMARASAYQHAAQEIYGWAIKME